MSRRLIVAIALLLLVAAPIAGCEEVNVAAPPPVTIVIGGSSAMEPVLRALTEEYSRQHPNVLFDLRGGGSTLGEEAIRAGRYHIAASTLFPPDPEAGRPAPPGDERLVRTPIGLNALAIIVHPSNSLSALSLVQLRDLYSGRVVNWQALGGDAGEIVLVSREDGAGARALFEERVMGDERMALTAVVMPGSQYVVDYVARHPAAIAYVSRSHVVDWIPGETPIQQRSEEPPPVKVLELEGRYPTREMIAQQQYALIQPLYLITSGPPSGQVRRFIDFVLSPAGQSIVARYHAPIR
ncbi:phosphate ABC transporter substrate-binding protein [Caldilinea sp.]|jgi:phosphate transport system substrate-binding protein|uniref:phosphate ABC transporter substrate-binding protein n=1 Tax=Caldilinea sp. TaxID=2293560 RepID=UPI00261F80C9|nr:phosphate ABC transporter substrate-binding protein [uncultured Caldilinea sp.]